MRNEVKRRDAFFDSDGVRCEAWLYEPASERPNPLVILAHGFTMVREARLDAYAERFAAAGFACLVFDYRHFGTSKGEPRQLLDIERQVADWHAALGYARTLEEVDPARIALWGTSFSGGHVVRVAGEDGSVAALVSQAPFAGMGGSDRPKRRVHAAKVMAAALRDELRGRAGRSPAYIPVAGAPGSNAAFDQPGAEALLRSLLPPDSSWRNQLTPRVFLHMATYRPFAKVAELRMPWLLCLADRDETTPADVAEKRAAQAPELTVKRYPIEHFDVYTGEWFERLVTDQVSFLAGHLLPHQGTMG